MIDEVVDAERSSQSAASFAWASEVWKCSPSQVKASAEASVRPATWAADEASLSRGIWASSGWRKLSPSPGVRGGVGVEEVAGPAVRLVAQ